MIVPQTSPSRAGMVLDKTRARPILTIGRARCSQRLTVYWGASLVWGLSTNILTVILGRTHVDLLLRERLIVRRRGENLLVHVGDDFDVVILIARELQILEAQGHVLLADAEKAAAANQRGDDVAVPVSDKVVDVADDLVLCVKDRLPDELAREPIVARLFRQELRAAGRFGRFRRGRRQRLRGLRRLRRCSRIGTRL